MLSPRRAARARCGPPLPYDPDGPYHIEVSLASADRAEAGCTPCRTHHSLTFGGLEQAVEEYRLLADLERVKLLLDIA